MFNQKLVKVICIILAVLMASSVFSVLVYTFIR